MKFNPLVSSHLSFVICATSELPDLGAIAEGANGAKEILQSTKKESGAAK